MRKMIIVLAATAGFGLLSSGGAIAAPFGGPVKWKKVCVKWKWVKY